MRADFEIELNFVKPAAEDLAKKFVDIKEKPVKSFQSWQ